MIKNQSFYQSILQNSILVIKVSGKICDSQENIDNVISDIKELLNSISKNLEHCVGQNHFLQIPGPSCKLLI